MDMATAVDLDQPMIEASSTIEAPSPMRMLAAVWRRP